jgi:1-acyl-sn-glycerol-3-phosphate acyltransferase
MTTKSSTRFVKLRDTEDSGMLTSKVITRKALAKALLEATGWTVEGTLPDAKKFVLIAAPHTSNWDLVYALACASVLGLSIHWMGKDSLFRGPMGVALRALGGIPVERSQHHALVQTLAHEFERRDRFVLLVPPEGTRKAVKYWKSGFYHIARLAGVPIALGVLDYRSKRVGLGPMLWPSDDLKADMDAIRRFYADKQGRHAADFVAPRLREEDEPRRA